MTNRYTREEIITLVGEAAVARLDRENCEPTNRTGYNGAAAGNEQIEWAATVRVDHDDYERLTAYYYTNASDEARVADFGGDWGSVDFVIDHYSLY